MVHTHITIVQGLQLYQEDLIIFYDERTHFIYCFPFFLYRKLLSYLQTKLNVGLPLLPLIRPPPVKTAHLVTESGDDDPDPPTACPCNKL